MTEKESALPAGFNDLKRDRLVLTALIPLALVIYYYWPCLSGQTEFYVSDLTYFYQPFCSFVQKEAAAGHFPLWNPNLYCGMAQLASPNPGLLYPPSWFIFLLPFSAGLSIYMIFHQLLLGAGSYIYLRQLNASRAASLYAGAVLTLSAYCFALIRNMTLPATIAWLPLALYFERKIQAGRSLKHMLGLALAVSMIVQAGRPEVGVPALALLLLAALSKPLAALWRREPKAADWQATLYKTSSLALGLALGAPSILPGLEWAALSPRSQGLELRWVLMWSANWYDYLSLVLSQPLGDLCRLDSDTAVLRHLVLSRGDNIPFLTSAYISPIAVTMAIWGLFCHKNKMRILCLSLLSAFILMSAGGYTPFAAAVVRLSPLFAAFRYPVKLLIFPCLLLVLLAVQGLDALLAGRLSLKVIKGTAYLWLVVFIAAVILSAAPQIGATASHWHWLFPGQPPLSAIKTAQQLMSGSMLGAAHLALAACFIAYVYYRNKLSPALTATLLILLSCAALINSALTYRLTIPAGFYSHPGAVARELSQLQKEQPGQLVSANSFRFVNLYFDPLEVPAKYKQREGRSLDENYYQYCRELLLYNTALSFQIASSYGYEAAETAEYKNWFTDAYAGSSQYKQDNASKDAASSDLPLQRFARLTASRYANTQVYKKAGGDISRLDKNCFELLAENRDLNYRIYRTINMRPRFYLTSDLNYLQSFKDFRKIICSAKASDLTRALDASGNSTFLLLKDYERHKAELNEIHNPLLPGIESADKQTGKQADEKDKIETVLDSAQELKLKINTASHKLLVIADHYYPGWVAELDGKRKDILPANLASRAVIIPPGEHELKMYYFSLPLLYGTVLAVLCLLLFLSGYRLICLKLSLSGRH